MIQGAVLYFETGERVIHGDTFCAGSGPRPEGPHAPRGRDGASPELGLAAAATPGRPAPTGLIAGPHRSAS